MRPQNANLRPPFQKGVSGNPHGKPKLPPGLAKIRELSKDEAKRLIAKYARMTKAQLQEAVSSENIPMIDLAICSIFAQAAKSGDYARLSFLLDRAIGRVGSERNDDTREPVDLHVVEPMDRLELIAAMKEQIKHLESA